MSDDTRICPVCGRFDCVVYEERGDPSGDPFNDAMITLSRIAPDILRVRSMSAEDAIAELDPDPEIAFGPLRAAALEKETDT